MGTQTLLIIVIIIIIKKIRCTALKNIDSLTSSADSGKVRGSESDLPQ